MGEEPKKNLASFIETVVMPMARDLELTTLITASAKEMSELLEGVSVASSTDTHHSYELSNRLVVAYFSDLPSCKTIDRQWLLGRPLFNQWFKSMFQDPKLMGRPSEKPDRIYLCMFVEWCTEVCELEGSRAIARAATLFNTPESKLNRWFFSGKGYYSEERAFARELIELFQFIRTANDKELQDYTSKFFNQN